MSKSASLILFVLLALFAGGSAVQAQTVPPSSTPPVSVEVFATINIYNAKIVSQKGNVFTIAFDITNREGVQPGVRYGISLVKVSGGAVTLVADEHVYDETLTLGAGALVHKSIIYTAPESLSGEYSLLLISKSSSGIPFALRDLGTVTLTGNKDSISIDSTSCYITISSEKNGTKHSIDTLLSISPSETLSLHCSVTNGTKESVTLVPSLLQHLRSAYGDLVPNSGSVDTVTVAAGAKKDFSVLVPKVTEAQKYQVAVSLHDASRSTNTIAFVYAMRGAGASIRTLLLDKDAYGKGDTATISFIWSLFVDSVTNGKYSVSTPLAELAATFTLTDGNGATCAAPIKLPLSESERLTKATMSVTADCRNPQVHASIADATFGTLDAQSFSVTSKVSSSSFFANILTFMKNSYVVGASIVLALLLSYVLYKRRTAAPIILLLLAFTFVGGARPAHADSATINYHCIPGQGCPLATTIHATGSLDQASYSPGQTIIFNVNMWSDDNPQLPSGVSPIAMGNINGGAWSTDVFPNATYTPQQLRSDIFGSVSLGVAPSVSGTVYTYYSSAGYNYGTGSIPLIVTVAVPPSVQLFFQ